MKTQQRNFVIEYKSRRQARTTGSSIWGKTDFKTLLREAESDTSELDAVDTAENKSLDVAPDVLPVAVSNAISTERENPPSVPGTNDEFGEVVDRSASKSTKTRKIRQAAAGEKSTSQYQNAVPVVVSSPVVAAVGLDELSSLEAENRKLKQILASQYSRENAQLRVLLARFVPILVS